MRALRPADAPAALAAIHAAFAAQQPTDPPPGALRETEASIAAALERGGAGIEGAAALVAVLLWREQDDALHLSRLAVRPEARGRGHARTLIAAAEVEARRRGLRRLTLGTRVELTGNHRLFHACGFVEVGRTAHPGHAAPTSIDMAKAL